MAKLKIESQFGIAPNSLVYNKEISFAAKGLYVYIQAKPQDWLFSAERIAYEANDSLYAVKKTLRELEKFGYLTRNKSKDEKGRWDIQYILHLKPTVEIEPRISSTVEIPPSDIRPTYKERLTNKEYISNIEDDINNIDSNIDSNITIDNTNTREKKKSKSFSIPSVEEVYTYCIERNNFVDAEKFHSHYTSVGWKVGKNPMKDWKAAVRTWEKNYNNKANHNGTEQQPQQERFIGRQSKQQIINALEHEQSCSYDPRNRK